jgi:TorA maturation chaperone TorD
MNSAIASFGEAQAKAKIFGFLAGVFRSHPTDDSVRALREMAAELWVAFPNGFSLSELDQEYMDLFVVPTSRYVAPYESVFRDEWPLPAGLRRGSNPAETGGTVKGLLMGESTIEVRQCYLEAGLLPEEDLPDHISNELSFLAHLYAREADAPAGEARTLAELRERFRQEHVVKWIGELRERVGERDRLGYYRAALEVAEAVLQEESDAVVVKPPLANLTASPTPGPSGCPWHGHGQ